MDLISVYFSSDEIRAAADRNCPICHGDGYDMSNWDNFPPVCSCASANLAGELAARREVNRRVAEESRQQRPQQQPTPTPEPPQPPVVDVTPPVQTYRHPMQPVVVDEHGVKRFKANAIVRYLLDTGGSDMNKLACLSFSDEDREQFAQLIGYSVGGFCDLSYSSVDSMDTATHMCESGLSEQEARIAMLGEKLTEVRDALRKLVPSLFNIHPDDMVS